MRFAVSALDVAALDAHARSTARDSSFDAFLYAEVGVEGNGTALTVLSMLARLGMDPWKQAATWERWPTVAVVDAVAACVARMPLPQSPADARGTATRLVALLPGHRPQTSRSADDSILLPAPRADWRALALFWAVLAFGAAVNVVVGLPAGPAVATDHAPPRVHAPLPPL
jgi:hypothetical protein